MRAGIRIGDLGCPRRFVLVALLAASFATLAGCREKTAVRSDDGGAVSEPTIQDVLEKESLRLMALPGVVAVGEGRTADGRPCVKIWVDGLTLERRARFPKTVGPYPVELEDSGGPIRAMPDTAAPR